MRIGELARQAEVSTDTLRFYEKRGLIRSERRANGYRDFDEAMLRVVRMIRLGQKIGFQLRELEVMAAQMRTRDMSSDEVADLLRAKIGEVDEKLADLSSLRGMLVETLGQVCPLTRA